MKKHHTKGKQIGNTSAQHKPEKSSAPSGNTINRFIDEHALLILLGALLLIVLWVFGDFIFLKKLLLYKDTASDTVNSLYPTICHYADYIRSSGFPKWSFNFGMGQNIFPFFLHDPLDLFLYLAGKDAVGYGITYIEVFKVIAGGVLFFLYLRTISFSSVTCIAGGLLFAFSGFMILNTGWYTFSFEALNAALLLLAFERLFKRNSWILFPVAVTLIGISQPFNLYIYGLFIAVYATFRFIDERGWEIKAYAKLMSKLLLYGLLGVAISSFFLFPNILQIMESPRGSGKFSYFNTLSSSPVFSFGSAKLIVTELLRFFSTDLMGTGDNFKGWNNYMEAPTFYSGLLSLLLFPVAFQFLDKRRRIIYAAFLAMWIIPLIFPYFRYAFWLFSGDYYRAFSFFVSLVILYFGLTALDKIIKAPNLNALVLIATSLVLIIILSLDYSGALGAGNKLNESMVSLSRILIIIYTVIIYLLGRQSFKTTAKILLLLMLCIELGYFSYVTVNDRIMVSGKEFKSRTGYNDYSLEAIDYVKDHDKSFYRIDKNYSSGPSINYQSINDGLAQDYRGTSSYYQFNQLYYVLFLDAVGKVSKDNKEENTRWALGTRGSPALEIIGNVKYILDKAGYNLFNYDSLARFEDVRLLKNKYYLPLGFTYDKYMLSNEFLNLNEKQRDYVMMRAFFIGRREENDYSGLERISLKDTVVNYYPYQYAEDVKLLRQDTLAITEFNQNLVRGKINLDKKKLLFLSIPYDKGWKAKVDGKDQELKIVDAGMMGLLLDKGTHEIEMKFFPRLFKEGLIVSMLSLALFGSLIWIKRVRKKVS